MTEQEIRKRKEKELLEREELLERAKKLIGLSVFYEGEPRKIEDVGYIEGWGFDFNLENYHIIYFGEKGLIDFLESGEHRDSITGELICWLVPTAKVKFPSDVSTDDDSEYGLLTTEIWKQRWWDVYFENYKHGSQETIVQDTNNAITRARNGINEYFKEK